MRRTVLLKLILGLVAVAVFGVLFIRSVRNTGAAPYTMARSDLAGWTVALDPNAATSGVVLALWPPNFMARGLFSQLFSRSGLSLTGPNPVAMPTPASSWQTPARSQAPSCCPKARPPPSPGRCLEKPSGRCIAASMAPRAATSLAKSPFVICPA